MRWRVGVLVAIACTGTARASTDDVFHGLRFGLATPGARATGLGGAFVAAAADATAATANPAALHYVDRSEVLLDYRFDRVVGSSASGESGSTAAASTEPYADLSATTRPEDTASISFAGFVYPFRIGKRPVALAVSRTVQLASDGSSESAAELSLLTFPVVVDPSTSPPSVVRAAVLNATTGTLESRLVQYDVSFAFAVGADFSVGLSAGLAEMSMQSTVLAETQDPRNVLVSIHPRVDLAEGGSIVRTRIAVDDTSTANAFSVGLHWHPNTAFPSGVSPVRFGLVYRHGAEFSLAQTRESFDPDTGTFEPQLGDPLASFENSFKVPDRWAVGASYEVGRRWLVTADLERVRYSDLTEDLRTGATFFTSDLISDDLLPGRSGMHFTVDDATVPRAGVECDLGRRGRWSGFVRAGYFLDPDHGLRLTDVDTGDAATDRLLLELFDGGEDVEHYTVGFSVGTPVGLRLDFAGDLSDAGDRFVATGAYRFGAVRR